MYFLHYTCDTVCLGLVSMSMLSGLDDVWVSVGAVSAATPVLCTVLKQEVHFLGPGRFGGGFALVKHRSSTSTSALPYACLADLHSQPEPWPFWQQPLDSDKWLGDCQVPLCAAAFAVYLPVSSWHWLSVHWTPPPLWLDKILDPITTFWQEISNTGGGRVMCCMCDMSQAAQPSAATLQSCYSCAHQPPALADTVDDKAASYLLSAQFRLDWRISRFRVLTTAILERASACPCLPLLYRLSLIRTSLSTEGLSPFEACQSRIF